jgi:hypothetical protein
MNLPLKRSHAALAGRATNTTTADGASTEGASTESGNKRARTGYADERLRKRTPTPGASAAAMAPQTQPPASGLLLTNLPDDQILQMAQHLKSSNDIAALRSTCQRMHNVLPSPASQAQKLIARARTLVPPPCVEAAKLATVTSHGHQTPLPQPLTQEVTQAYDELVAAFDEILGPHNAPFELLTQPSVRSLPKLKKENADGSVETAKHQSDVLQALVETLAKWPDSPQKTRLVHSLSVAAHQLGVAYQTPELSHARINTIPRKERAIYKQLDIHVLTRFLNWESSALPPETIDAVNEASRTSCADNIREGLTASPQDLLYKFEHHEAFSQLPRAIEDSQYQLAWAEALPHLPGVSETDKEYLAFLHAGQEVMAKVEQYQAEVAQQAALVSPANP